MLQYNKLTIGVCIIFSLDWRYKIRAVFPILIIIKKLFDLFYTLNYNVTSIHISQVFISLLMGKLENR